MTNRPTRPPSEPPPVHADAGVDAGPVRRVAGVQLRGRGGPLPARAYWPAPPGSGPAPALLVLFPADPEPAGLDAADPLCRRLCAGAGLVVLSVSHLTPGDATTAAQWAADHAGELGADPGRLLVGGVGAGGRAAAAVVRQAGDDGWPAIERQLLVRPELGADPGFAPATVVTVADPTDDGQRGAARLRDAGVDVDELRYGEPPVPERLAGDLARALAPAPPTGWDPDRRVSP